MAIPTVDPHVVIEEDALGPPRRTVFHDLSTGERWVRLGDCDRCGLCEIGAVHAPGEFVWDPEKRPGEPGAAFDTTYGQRLELPERPSIIVAMARMAVQIGSGKGCAYEFEALTAE